jgi:uncharacterized protein
VKSRLTPEFDLFEVTGKRTGFIRLPHSVHRSAYGYIPIPAAVIARGDGPTVLMMAGNHGDEYEGQIALGNLIRSLRPEEIDGRIVVLPSANFPAAIAGTRTSPIDQGNLNRSFPGGPDGGVTEQIAWFIEETLMPQVDVLLDLHSGGSSLMYIPAALARRSDDPAAMAETVALLRAFGAPIAYLTQSPQGADRTASSAAQRKGARHLGTELGGGGQVTPAALRACEAGLRRVLHRLGVLRDAPAEPAPPTRLFEVGGADYFVHAPEDGLFEPLVELGDTVRAGQAAARIHWLHTPWREPASVAFERDGVVLCKRVPGHSLRGDCLFHLGTDWTGD